MSCDPQNVPTRKLHMNSSINRSFSYVKIIFPFSLIRNRTSNKQFTAFPTGKRSIEQKGERTLWDMAEKRGPEFEEITWQCPDHGQHNRKEEGLPIKQADSPETRAACAQKCLIFFGEIPALLILSKNLETHFVYIPLPLALHAQTVVSDSPFSLFFPHLDC